MSNRMNYDKVLRFLYNLQLSGIKVGLNTIAMLLRRAGNPENHFPSVHIAGTNGKGSTASMIASILTASGYRTGLYTSPHLVDFSERIRIDGKKISKDDIVKYTQSLQPQIVEDGATFFEVTTAIAFRYFADRNVDIAVIETGLGGRWDATNVISPLLSIISNIDIEHTEYLGNTYESIAAEKGGIIKPFIPCLTATNNRRAFKTLRSIARKNNSTLIHTEESSFCSLSESMLHGQVVFLQTIRHDYPELYLSLAGEYQLQNLRLAVLAVEYLHKAEGFRRVTNRTVRLGLSDVRKFSGLRGRFEVIQKSPLIIGDVAHNPHGIKTLVETIRKFISGKVICLVGIMKDKDYGEMVNALLPITRTMVVVSPTTARAQGSAEIIDHLHSKRIQSFDGGGVATGFQKAFLEGRTEEPILITGSHHTVGEVFEFLNISP